MPPTALDQLTVRRSTPSLVFPARPTPMECMPLSDIDDQESMRIYSAIINLFRGGGNKSSLDPATVLRAALGELLVHYYPLAGRLREGSGRKLVVECAGQGVVFVEAEADIAADDLGDVRCPPFTYLDEFLPDGLVYLPSGLPAIVDQPLLYVQVTRLLKCGGFILGILNCHCISDAPGLVQMMKALGELARGAPSPSVTPVWAREMFNARQPPRPSFPHMEYQEPTGDDVIATTPRHDMVPITLSFGREAIAGLRSQAPAARCSRFDLIAACIWRSRTAALGYSTGEEVRLSIVLNARGRSPAAFGAELPFGFYGNALAYTVASCKAGELCKAGGLAYAVGLIREAKARITYQYLQSVADMMVLRGRPIFAYNRTLIVSDLGLAGFDGLDFGWGKAVYSGPARAGGGILLGVNTYFLRLKDDNGMEETIVTIYLPRHCTLRFQMEVEALKGNKLQLPTGPVGIALAECTKSKFNNIASSRL